MKKGIELSISFIVVIVIALVIFMLGVRFIYDLASEATELESITTSELDRKIEALLCDSGDRVCIGIEKKTIPKGKFDVFGIKIINIFDAQDFDVIVSRPTPSGYTPNNNEILTDELDWKPKSRTINLERNEEREIGIGIEVPKDAQSGTYIFDVRVLPYDTLHKIYAEVP